MDKKVSTATIVRTVCLALALVNQLLSAGGHSVIPIDNETVNQLVTAGVTIVTAIVNWWYNNSFTEAAIEADKTFERVREKNRS
ncbi:phage holin [Faecalibacterium prausnitzii]|jgi:SPP1 family holin|uniref:phage holin n=1 Tax=Faecalibacterium prausnitzii TaxID=853 RepID=UPI003C2AB271